MSMVTAMPCGNWTAEVAEHENKIKAIREEARSGTVIAIFDIGRELTAAQEKLACHGNGTFGKWVNTRLKFSKRLIYLYLKVYRVFNDQDRATVAQFDRSALYYLVQGGIPKNAVIEMIARAKNRTHITQKIAMGYVKALMYQKEFPQDSEKEDSEKPTNVSKVAKVNMTQPPTVVDRLKKLWEQANHQERKEFSNWVVERKKNINVPNTLV